MSKYLSFQENIYQVYLRLKSRKKQQEFLEKCFVFAFENREISSSSEVDLAFFGVKPSLKLKNSGGGNNNPDGKNQHNSLKNNDSFGQSEVSQRSELGQSFINNKDINNKKENIINNLYEKEFEEFWNNYPKQRIGNKKKAYTSFCRVIKENRSTIEHLLKVVKLYANSEEVKRGFAKGCEAWLNGDKFNNEYKPLEEKPSQWRIQW